MSFQAQSGLLFPKDYKDMEAKKRRGKPIEDLELAAFAQQIGPENYRREYNRLYFQGKYNKKSYHGRKDHKSKAELEAIKQKYKNGVTREHINEMVGL